MAQSMVTGQQLILHGLERETDRDRQSERQKNRETERVRDRQTETETERDREILDLKAHSTVRSCQGKCGQEVKVIMLCYYLHGCMVVC